MAGISDPKTYRKMLVPFANQDEFDAAASGFWDDVMAARKKHRIADVHFICIGSYVLDTGEESEGLFSGHIGNVSRGESMVAYELGKLSQEREKLIDTMAAPRKVRTKHA